MFTGAETFSSDATAIMQQLVHNRMLQAQVVGHEVDNVPYVQLYELQGDQVRFFWCGTMLFNTDFNVILASGLLQSSRNQSYLKGV